MDNSIETQDTATESVDLDTPSTDPRELHTQLRASQPDLNLQGKLPGDDNIWYVDENKPGEGEKPEWFVDKTFKNVMAQAKAYNDARKRITELGDKLKAHGEPPDKYEEVLPEELKDFKFESELVENDLPALKKLAREEHMTQKTFGRVFDFFVKYLKKKNESEMASFEEHSKSVLEKIDPNPDEAKRKLTELRVWLKQNYPQIDLENEGKLPLDSSIYYVLNYMRDKAPKNDVPTQTLTSQQSLYEEHQTLVKLMGDKRYSHDQLYTNHVDKKYREFHNRAKRSGYKF